MKHRHKLYIRFSDIDAFGHVNNANYLTYIEEARVHFFDDVIDYPYDWSKEGVIVARAEVDFSMPVHFKDEIIIETSCSRIGTKSFDLSYKMIRIENEKEILVASATTVMVAFEYKSKKSILIPEEWKKALKNYSEL